MDIYDPQTLGIMVFGGFMVFSAIGIALVSTFSMKETSYEEALAKQRRELGKIQPGRSEKKKKDKISEKKNRGKKKEEKPNGKIPEQEKMEEAPDTDAVIEPVSAPLVATAPAPAFDDKPVAALQPVDKQQKTAEPSPAAEPSHTPSPNDKKKKKVAKVEPGSQQAVIVSAPALVQTSALPSSTQAPAKGNTPPSTTAPAKAVPVSSKSAPTSAKSAPAKAAAAAPKSSPPSAKSSTATPPASSKSAPAAPPASSKSATAAPPASSKSATATPASSKSAPAAPSSSKSAPAAPPASLKSAPAAPSSSKSAPAAPPASSKSATAAPASSKSATAAPASSKSATAAPASSKSATAAPASSKTVSVAPASSKTVSAAPHASAKSTTAAPPASPKQASAAAKSAPTSAKAVTAPVKSSSAPGKTVLVLETVTKDVPVMAVPPVGSQKSPVVTSKAQESKKKSSKKKSEPAVDPTLYLPYKALVSTISSMVFSEQEAHRLIEILSEKAGIIQDTWHTATQKGDPVATLKKQLEEKEKQLAAEQEDASAAKNRLRELTKELAAEKTKVASVETRLSSQLSKREQEMIALKARMQASYQDHVAQAQRLNAKILSLQDQLEKGPSAQLARLQQENSILRDALNQATSQAESKQNAELAKLRQECAKLTKELEDKTESLLSAEHIRKGLEAKVSTAEKQLSLLQASHTESEQALQRMLEEVREELRTTQSRNSSLQVTLDKAQQDTRTLSEFQVRAERLEVDIKERCAQVDALTAQIEEAKAEKSQLVEQLASINSLLEASQNQKVEEDNQVNAAEPEQLKLSLKERDNQLNTLHEELKQLQIKQEAAENTIVELKQRNKSEDASLITSLQEELTNLKEEMVQLKNRSQSDHSAEHAQLQISLKEKDVLVTSLQEQLREMTDVNTMAQLTAFQTETKESLQSLFPQIPLEMEQSNWLQVFTQKAQEALTSQSQESQSSPALPELLEKLKEAEGSYGSLQAECEQYRTVLADTEGMLKHLQKSVEEEELVWKSKMSTTEEQLRVALEKVSKLEAENLSVKQLKEQMMLLEAQLEKQADSQGTLEEINQLKLQLSECQSQLDLAQKESQVQKEELVQVREQLGKITMWAQHEQNGPTEPQPSQVHNELTQTTEKLHGETAQRQQLSEEFEQAQKTITEFQAQLDLLKVSAESPQTDTEDIAQLKERLEKEKKLSKDLGQAATKLQQLLKATQEQLTKEREAVRTLQEHLEGKEDYVELKEGTSV